MGGGISASLGGGVAGVGVGVGVRVGGPVVGVGNGPLTAQAFTVAVGVGVAVAVGLGVGVACAQAATSRTTIAIAMKNRIPHPLSSLAQVMHHEHIPFPQRYARQTSQLDATFVQYPKPPYILSTEVTSASLLPSLPPRLARENVARRF